ncbi:polysaccharide pyruvyl transferase family protein [Anaerosporobacter sp.]|uniref:polysaccharide pyruvyl transferase family protein n=1 Tax=Anaerosporobacter sp. TaxID=1872529 RepID=UPI00286F599B|nr:polysaccharide pyruvyl transferase family protein [Anaerosporobacter sp.]
MNKDLKIGIISVDINTPMFNYGAILHTWAFEKYLVKKNFTNFENIDYLPDILKYQNRLFPIFDLFTNTHKRLSLRYSLHYFQYIKKLKKINNFCKNKMINSKKQYKYSNIGSANLDYDVLIAEDDVIWAPGFLCRKDFVDKTFFLAHDNMKKCKKLSYSASMAECDFNIKDYPKLREYLSDFYKISVRESYARDFIVNKLELPATKVLDAVFLLEAEEYDSIISNRFTNFENYVLLYLPADDNTELRNAALNFAKEKNSRIIEVTNQICSSKNIFGDCGLEDFLSSIKYATAIFTNSFHAICFAVLFEKDFYAFSRKSGGKVKDICESFGILNRYYPKKYIRTDDEIDYTKVSSRVKELSEESRKWLMDALEEVCK